MLIEFRVENHRSLREEQVLTMEAGRIGDTADPRLRNDPGHAEKLLTVAVLYGANASGKSNVLSALAFMRDAVLYSHRVWSSDEGIPREPFAWGSKRPEPSLFEVTLLIDGVRYQYGFRANDECFIEEWLHAWPHGKKQVWFERDNDAFRFVGENLKGENKLIQEVTRPNALFLSVADQHKHIQLQPFLYWFKSLRPINIQGGRSAYRSYSSDITVARLFDENNQEDRQVDLFPTDSQPDRLTDRFRSMLVNADFGIVDVRVEKHESEMNRLPRWKFYLRHKSVGQDAWLPLSEESRGTQTLFRLALPILQTINRGGVLLVDELEASLHPSLAQHIISQFNDPVTNPHNAQLICTTHDTNLLGTALGDPVLRRDQVWLTEKDQEGATVLYPLTDYKPRKSENIERAVISKADMEPFRF